MEILSQYLNRRKILEDKLNKLLSSTYPQRNQLLIDVLSDEIVGMDFAIAEMRKAYSDKYGYRPRRDTLLTRTDFYRSL